MPNRGAVLHPRFMPEAMAQFYTSTIAIEAATVVQDPDSGQETPTWAEVSGLGAIPAAVAPLTIASVGNGETDTVKQSFVVNAWQVSLNGYYPGIIPTMRARLDDGRVFDIRGVEADSHLQMTRLKMQEVI